MVKSKFIRVSAMAVTSLGLVAGLAGVAGASAGVINTTGPDSSNKVVSVSKSHTHVNNNNHITLASENSQGASSGDAKVRDNTTGGDAKTGSASNSAALAVSLSVSNGSSMGMDTADPSVSGDGTIKNTGPDSDNKIVTVSKVSTDVNNNNCITISTSNEQEATSGDAKVSHNTTGGDATSGNASNTSTGSFTIDIQN